MTNNSHVLFLKFTTFFKVFLKISMRCSMSGEIINENISEQKIASQLKVHLGSFDAYQNENNKCPSIRPTNSTSEKNYEADIEKIAVPSSN